MKRPSGPRTHWLTVRMTAEEYAVLQAKAAGEEITLSDLARLVLLRHRVRRPAIPRVNLAALDQLHRLGNNLNQLVKLLHQGRAPVGLKGVLDRLLALCGEIRSLLAGESPQLGSER